jgi:hypothetical protein
MQKNIKILKQLQQHIESLRTFQISERIITDVVSLLLPGTPEVDSFAPQAYTKRRQVP